MMRKGLRHRNDKGSALIMVIVAMLFIGIIAAIVLSIAHSNLELSKSGKQSTTTFYKGEKALDELKTKLYSFADDAFKNAYEVWLTNYTVDYADMDKDHQTAAFRQLFADQFYDLIKDYVKTPLSGVTPIPTPIPGKYGDLLFNSDVEVHGVPEVVLEKDEDGNLTGNFRIKGISVTEDIDGVITNILTDMVFNITPPSVKIGAQTGVDAELAQYALITNRTIDFTNANYQITGSVYGGGKLAGTDEDGNPVDAYNGAGILVSGASSNVTLNSADIVTRSRIETNNLGKLNIKGKLAGDSDEAFASVWAQNIWMSRHATGSTNSTMNVKGTCYVGDDLTIDGDGSSFTLTGDKSGYVGYSTSSKRKESETNSAIVINGKNVTLDLEAASRLWLFGKTYVTVPQRWGQIGGAEGLQRVHERPEVQRDFDAFFGALPCELNTAFYDVCYLEAFG